MIYFGCFYKIEYFFWPFLKIKSPFLGSKQVNFWFLHYGLGVMCRMSLEFIISYSCWKHQSKTHISQKTQADCALKGASLMANDFRGFNPSQITVSLLFQDGQSIWLFYLSIPQMGWHLWPHEMTEWWLWEQWCWLLLGQELGPSPHCTRLISQWVWKGWSGNCERSM